MPAGLACQSAAESWERANCVLARVPERRQKFSHPDLVGVGKCVKYGHKTPTGVTHEIQLCVVNTLWRETPCVAPPGLACYSMYLTHPDRVGVGYVLSCLRHFQELRGILRSPLRPQNDDQSTFSPICLGYLPFGALKAGSPMIFK